MVDCACTNFPANLGNVTIGANLGVGMVPPVAPAGNIDVRSGATATPMSIKFGRTGEDGTLAVVGVAGQWSQQANAGDTTLRSMTASLNFSVQNDGGRILFTTGTADTTKLAITNFGHVGIGLGTDMPSERLEVRGPSVNSPVAITIGRSGSAADGALGVAAGPGQWAGPAVAGDVVLRASSASGSLVLAAITSGNVVLSTGSGARLTISNTGTVTIPGNVAIGGTAPPISRLSLGNASTGVANRIAVYEASGADFRGIGMANPPGAFGVAIWANQSPSDTNMRLFVRDDGNVGINTSTPSDRLHVGGTIRADGAIVTSGQSDISAGGDLRTSRDLIVANNATINQDLTAHSSIRAGDPSRKIAEGNGCYYA